MKRYVVIFEIWRNRMCECLMNGAVVRECISSYSARCSLYKKWVVLPARFQRAAFRLGGGRSMQLSYGSTMFTR